MAESGQYCHGGWRGAIRFTDAAFTYTLSGNPLTLDNTGVGNAEISVADTNGADQAIQNNLVLVTSLDVTNASPYTLTLSGVVST